MAAGRVRTLGRVLVRSVTSAVDHDCVNLAQSTAYSGIVALFPALIAAAAVVAVLPDTAPVRAQIALYAGRIVPDEVQPLLQSYFVAKPDGAHTANAVLGAVLLSLSGASGVIASLMEGIRRAHGLPDTCWTFWRRRLRALLLVPLALLPLLAASLLVVFGHPLAVWLGAHVPEQVRAVFLFVALTVRWAVALAASVGLIGVLYALGTPKRQPWLAVVPGAAIATVLWFAATIVFGWYVTRFANYSRVYGSLGAGIALLLWLNIISLCVLYGAEFNVQFSTASRAPFHPVLPARSTVPLAANRIADVPNSLTQRVPAMPRRKVDHAEPS